MTDTSATLPFQVYSRKPFDIEAVQITEENIADVAPLVGELKHKEDGRPYIEVNRKLIPNIYRVYPGYYLTRMDGKHRCYSEKVFLKQFETNV